MAQKVMRQMTEIAISEIIKTHRAIVYRRSPDIHIRANAMEAFAKFTETAYPISQYPRSLAALAERMLLSFESRLPTPW